MSAKGWLSTQKSLRGIRLTLLTSLALQHKVCLDHQGTPEIAGHKRVTNTQKKQRKKDDSKGKEEKPAVPRMLLLYSMSVTLISQPIYNSTAYGSQKININEF